MHRIPEDFDTSIFVGTELELVCFAAYTVHFSFSSANPVKVTLEGAYAHSGPEAEGWTDEGRLPTASSRLMQLTNHRVVEAERLDETRLRLVFDHGHSLTLIDDTDQYESFQIETEKHFWVV